SSSGSLGTASGRAVGGVTPGLGVLTTAAGGATLGLGVLASAAGGATLGLGALTTAAGGAALGLGALATAWRTRRSTTGRSARKAPETTKTTPIAVAMRFPAVCRLAARGGRTSSVSAPHQGAGSLKLSTGGARSTVACSEPTGGNGTGCGAAIGAD